MTNTTEPRRGPGRPPMRAETREQPRLQRKNRANQDKFAVPDRYKVDGFDYNWKTIEVMGKGVDAAELIERQENHWEPVMAGEIPGIMSPDYSGAIQKSGLMLMKRPKYLSDEAREEEVSMAYQQSGAKRAELSRGGENAGMPVRQADINSHIAGQQIPD